MSSQACSPDLPFTIVNTSWHCQTTNFTSQMRGTECVALRTHFAAWLRSFWADMYLAQYYDEDFSASTHPTIAVDSGYLLASQGPRTYTPVGATGVSMTHHHT